MAKTYDTQVLRASAAHLLDSADSVNSTSSRTLKWVSEDAADRLSGDAATALAEAARELDTEITACGRELRQIAQILRNYAYALDMADMRASEMIQAK